MKAIRTLSAALVIAGLSVGVFDPAQAIEIYNWSFTGVESGSGTLTSSAPPGVDFHLDPFGVSGTWNGSAIDTSIAFGFQCHVLNGLCSNNNIYVTPFFLDGNGFSFNTVAGHTVGIFFDGVTYVAEDAGPNGSVDFIGNFTVGVPGPVAGAGLPGLILAGGGLAGWLRRRKGARGSAA